MQIAKILFSYEVRPIKEKVKLSKKPPQPETRESRGITLLIESFHSNTFSGKRKDIFKYLCLDPYYGKNGSRFFPSSLIEAENLVSSPFEKGITEIENILLVLRNLGIFLAFYVLKKKAYLALMKST